MNVGVLKAPEYRQGPIRCLGRLFKTFRTQDAINTVASEITLHRLDLLAMRLYMVPYISPKLVGKHDALL
jgi:hypothetical protein